MSGEVLYVALAALAIDATAGYPAALYRRIRHPVVWIGALIGALDRRWNAPGHGFAQRRLAGIAAVGVILVAVLSVTLPVAWARNHWPWLGGAVEALLAASLIAQRSLYEHVQAVAVALRDEGLAGGRRAVAMIVGRDPASLDLAGVRRAACESLAENFSDGVIAPLMWLALLGLPGIAVYKAINTADSMIGHRTSRHHAFGWAAARLDDLLNLPAARLTGLLICTAALLRLGPRAAGAGGRAMLRCAPRHRSPNAGWPEAALAGACGWRLGGPRRYGPDWVEDVWMGDGDPDPGDSGIFTALGLYVAACGLAGVGLLAIALMASLG